MHRYRESRLLDYKQPGTVNLELSCLSRLYKVAKQENYFAGENPVQNITPFEIHYVADRILFFEEEKKLLKHSALYLRRIIICALNTGMRRGNIIGLKCSNLKLDKGHVILETTV